MKIIAKSAPAILQGRFYFMPKSLLKTGSDF